jgi:hypothetical protein
MSVYACDVVDRYAKKPENSSKIVPAYFAVCQCPTTVTSVNRAKCVGWGVGGTDTPVATSSSIHSFRVQLLYFQNLTVSQEDCAHYHKLQLEVEGVFVCLYCDNLRLEQVLPYVLAAVTPPVVFYAKLACERFTVFKHEASQTLSTNWEYFRHYP